MAVTDIPTPEVSGSWRRVALALLGPGCAAALLLACYRPVLWDGEQFAYRDAAHFYYPLYLRVQQEWRAGRWPLWDPWQNGGQPLLGNPMAAVLYPGKLIYAFLPYAWGARMYVVAHTALAFLGMMALARTLGTSRVGASLGGLSYAFGAPVLFQYCNVIFLVGAAWVPWGLRAIDRLVRQRRRSGVPELAVILALQVLGGDPEAAYLTVACGAGYAALLALHGWRRPSRRVIGWLALALGGAWIVAALGLAYGRASVPGWLGWIWVPAVLAWGAVGGWVVWRWRHVPGDRLGPGLAGLAGAAALAMALAAAQLVPVAEFIGASSRMGENSPLKIDRFSVEPYRLVELLWPGVFGPQFPENRSWIQAIPPADDREIWEPSLYVGGLTLLLALGAAGSREGHPWRAWLLAIAAIGLVASFGKFGGPLFWLRWIPGVASALGPHDPLHSATRRDGSLNDGTSSVYVMLTALLPGLGLFRYPSKLLTFAAAAGAALAGLGWDDVAAGRSRRFGRGCGIGLVASVAALVPALAWRGRAVALLSGRVLPGAVSGPVDIPGAWAETQRALAQGTLICAAGWGLARWGPRRPIAAGALALLVLAVDLGLASPRLVWTAPQAVFDVTPEVARRIEAAERAEPAPGPFRVHVMPLWHPERFATRRSPGRTGELIAWERGTLQPLHALPMGLEYCATSGILEVDERLLFFRSQTLPASQETARALGVEPGQSIYYYPRRSYDLWGARYLILPMRGLGWDDEQHGYASFLARTEVLHPDPSRLTAPPEVGRWAEDEDWQLVRNEDAYPRAWLVHFARVVPPVTDAVARSALMHDIVFQNDPIWSDPERPVYDLRAMAWIEADDRRALRGTISRAAVEPGETVTVTRHEPQRVELKARLKIPGVVVLADTYYPGWHLTIDGRPAPILRANRMMRGAAVPAGDHTLVYAFDPPSFRIGVAVSLAGLAALLGLLLRQSWPVRNATGARASPGAL
jgi:hypothetical protein